MLSWVGVTFSSFLRKLSSLNDAAAPPKVAALLRDDDDVLGVAFVTVFVAVAAVVVVVKALAEAVTVDIL